MKKRRNRERKDSERGTLRDRNRDTDIDGGIERDMEGDREKERERERRERGERCLDVIRKRQENKCSCIYVQCTIGLSFCKVTLFVCHVQCNMPSVE